MATTTNLPAIAGDGPATFNWSILQDGSPLNLATVVVTIILKGGNDMPDPTTGSNVFTVANGGLSNLNNSAGTGSWTVPATITAEPATLWWHGTFTAAGVVTTWGAGQLIVSAT